MAAQFAQDSVPLQNHPGEPVFPVGPMRLVELSDSKRALVTGVGGLGVFVALLGGFLVGLSTEGPEFARGVAISGGVTVLAGVSLFAVSIVLFRKARMLRIREQQRYYQLGRVQPLTSEQRSALHLDGINTAYGHWSETLEDWPCEARLGHLAPQFRTFGLLTTQHSREELDQSWGVIKKEDFHQMVERLFQGMHSRSFAGVAAGPDGAQMFQRVSDLLGVSRRDVARAASSSGGNPPRLLWAFDLWRALRMARDAYMAGLVPEDEAWATITKASAWIHTLFDDLADFQFNVRMGHAFWCNDLAQINERKRVLDSYFENDPARPIRDLPWKKGRAPLPTYVVDGFASSRTNPPREDDAIGEAAVDERLLN